MCVFVRFLALSSLIHLTVSVSHLVAWGDDLFDDDAVGQHQHFGDGGEEHACRLHHAGTVAEHRPTAAIRLRLLQAAHVSQLGDGITYRWQKENFVIG